MGGGPGSGGGVVVSRTDWRVQVSIAAQAQSSREPLVGSHLWGAVIERERERVRVNTGPGQSSDIH